MPEHKNGHWEPLPNPPYEELALCQEVYQIWPTGEIFTDYEKYCERLFMYNQPEWTCKFSGKSGLTFNEALASEDRMRKSLDAFPDAWKGPLLAFVQHATASIEQISIQFMDFVRVNFIPGEDVKIDFDGRKMNAKIISSSQVPNSNDISYRLEIFQDENCTELVGEANVIGSASFTRERLNLNRAMIKRYVRSVAVRRSPNLPWFIPDSLAHQFGIATELPEGITPDMKPPTGLDGQFLRQVVKTPGMLNGIKSGSSDQMSIEEFFGGSKESASAAAQESLPQFNFPCDDAQVPVELIDVDLPFPELKPVTEFISESSLLTRSMAIWSFLQTFSPQLQLSPFSYDDWEESISCTDPSVVKNPLLEETMLALLSTLMKDRRNLVKAAFAERIKNLVLSFAVESAPVADVEMTDATMEDENEAASEEEKPEIIIFSDEDDSAEPFVKRPRQQSKSSALLPSIDLRRHRWYETKAMDQWHFVLASFFLEAIEMLRDEIDPAEGISESESVSVSDKDVEVVDESAPKDKDEAADAASEVTDASGDSDSKTAAQLMKAAKTAAISNFIDTFDLIVDEYTKEGSRHLFSRFLALSLHAKFCLIEFLIHANYDREAFKAHLEDCLEQQTELRRLRREVEIELGQVTAQLEEIESKAAILKAENAEISERLDADDEIALSEEEEEESGDEGSEQEKEAEQAEEPQKPPLEPLTDEQRQELTAKRAANKKEINSLNASLRRLRPEHTGLQRRYDNICRDCRKAASFRTFPLGEDRQGRVYWWFGEFVHPMPRILVAASADERAEWLGAIDSVEGFDQLLAWLNALGIREAKLKCALLESEADLRQFLEPRNLPVEESQESSSSSSDEEVEEIVQKKRGRGRPKGSFGGKRQAARERPFQRYKNAL